MKCLPMWLSPQCSSFSSVAAGCSWPESMAFPTLSLQVFQLLRSEEIAVFYFGACFY